MTKIKIPLVPTVDLTQGIPVQKLIQFLKRDDDLLILKGKLKRIEVERDLIRVVQNQSVLDLEQLPSEVHGMEISDLQKQVLLLGDKILVGNKTIQISANQTELVITHNNKPQQNRIK